MSRALKGLADSFGWQVAGDAEAVARNTTRRRTIQSALDAHAFDSPPHQAVQDPPEPEQTEAGQTATSPDSPAPASAPTPSKKSPKKKKKKNPYAGASGPFSKSHKWCKKRRY